MSCSRGHNLQASLTYQMASAAISGESLTLLFPASSTYLIPGSPFTIGDESKFSNTSMENRTILMQRVKSYLNYDYFDAAED